MKRYFSFDFYKTLHEAINIYFKVLKRMISIIQCPYTQDRDKLIQLKFLVVSMQDEIESAEAKVIQSNFLITADDHEEVVEKVTIGPVKCNFYLN